MCVPSKIEDLNGYDFKLITGKNKSKILRKDISYQRKCKFDDRKCNLNQK